MEKKSNSTSSRSSSICSRIQKALASYPAAFRAIHRIKQYNNKPEPPNNKPITLTTTTHSNNPPSSSSNSSPNEHTAKNTASVFQSNPPLPQHVKVMNTKGGGGGGGGEGASIPINFDYSTTTPSSLSSTSSISKVATPHHIKAEPRKGHHHHHHHGLEMQHSSEQQQQQQEQGGKKPLDINDAFAEYIQRTRYNIDQKHHDEAHGVGANNNTNTGTITSNKMENQKDHFSDFIQRARKRLRTTSNVAKAGGSFKRG